MREYAARYCARGKLETDDLFSGRNFGLWLFP